MRAMARSVPRACGDGSLHAWSARHLTVKWTGAGDDNRVGTVSTPGRKGGVPVRVGGILSGIPILDFDACEVQTKLN